MIGFLWVGKDLWEVAVHLPRTRALLVEAGWRKRNVSFRSVDSKIIDSETDR